MKSNNESKEKLIDVTQDEFIDKISFETASIARRLSAYIIDVVIIVALVYIASIFLYKPIDNFVHNLGIDETDFDSLLKYEEFKELFYRLILNLILAWTAIRLVYFTLVPALIGNGRTVGKLVAGIGVVDAITAKEISPSKLMLREFVGRILIETFLVIPGLVSITLAMARKDSKTIRDLLAKTVVIKLDLYDLE